MVFLNMSLLSKQIARLNQQSLSQGVQSDSKKNRRPISLLFSPTDAAEIDATSLLELAKSSLAELQHRDVRLLDFANSLFHASSVSLDRALLDKSENARLDKSLGRFLLLLSPYSSTKAAHRVSVRSHPRLIFIECYYLGLSYVVCLTWRHIFSFDFALDFSGLGVFDSPVPHRETQR